MDKNDLNGEVTVLQGVHWNTIWDRLDRARVTVMVMDLTSEATVRRGPSAVSECPHSIVSPSVNISLSL